MGWIRTALLASVAVAPLHHAWADPAIPAAAPTPAGQPVPADKPEQISVRLDRARAGLQPDLGAEVYRFGTKALATIPQGDNTPLNQVLLQAPGVAQDSFGQIHVRGDHDEVQYRIDGVELPEGLSVFAQSLETRFAHDLSLTTGALPAQYGFLQAAVINIDTKSGSTDPGGEISLYGGARDYLQPSFAYGTSAGRWSLFVTGDALHDRVGIENPTGTFNAIHDLSNQYHDLAKLSFIPDSDTRISLIVGVSNAEYQIPNNPGQTPTLGLSVNGVTDYNSSDLTEKQREITDFGILSLQKQIGTLDLQVSAFTRYSALNYTPDEIGDLLFNGISQVADRSVMSTGTQTDASWRINDTHTLRFGDQLFVERNVASTASTVLPQIGTGSDGAAIYGDVPETVYDGVSKTGTIYGVYVQDEWRILPQVTINYGARFDGVSEYVSATQLSPRVNVVWRATDSTTLHAGYSRYFTPPPFEEVTTNNVASLANTTGAATVGTNDKVEPERDNYFDAGIDQIVLPGLHVGLDAYYKQATDLIDEGQFGAPVILTAFNYAKGEVHGYEASLSYDRGPLSLYANLAWSRAIGKDIVSSQFDFDAQELAYISEHWVHLDHDQRWTGSAGIAYSFFYRGDHPLRGSLDLVQGSGLRADAGDVPNGAALPGYAVANLSFVQSFKTGLLRRTSFRLDVLNLLDRTYIIRDGTGIGVGAPQYGLRRTILGGVTERF